MKDIKFLRENGVNVEKSLELFGDITLYNETMGDFLEGIDLKKQRLFNFKMSLDLPNYAIFAHSVKSDARYLGFETIADEALKHEMAGKEDNQKFIEDNYDEFVKKIDFMINVVNRYLTEEPDAAIEVLSANKKLIVVDDSPLITSLIQKSMSSLYDVIVFNDGLKAKEYISKCTSPANLLLDLNIPDVSGFDILSSMSLNGQFNIISTSIITGDESEDTIKKAFEYPIVDMLPKPFSIDQLQSVVEKTANKNQI